MTRTQSLSALPTSVDDEDRGPTNRRLHLLLLTDTSIQAPGGSERFLRNLAARLPPERYQITIVQLAETNRAWSDTGIAPAFKHVRMRSFPMGAAYSPSGLRVLYRIVQMLQRESFDIVQSQHEVSDLFNALLPRRRGTVHLSNRRDMGFNKTQRLRWLFLFLNHRFDCVIAPSQPILASLSRTEKIAAERMVWIPNGVDTQRFRPAPTATKRAVRDEHGIHEAAIVFGCVARLTEVKRHTDLLQAFSRLHTQLPSSHLMLIGDGPLREQLARQIDSFGLQASVHMLGDRSETESLLAVLDVAVLASSTEGMSNAILESMACGLPTIATAVGGNVQLVHDGVNGRLVPPCAPDALADAMLALATSAEDRTRMGAAARTQIEREYSLEEMVRSYDRLYANVLDQP